MGGHDGRNLHPETLAVHAGAQPDPATGALAPPIHLSTTFRHGPAGETEAGYEYVRGANPTQDRLEAALAAVEAAPVALAFASGMAAIDHAFADLPPGSQVLLPQDYYHGVRALAREFLPARGISTRMVDQTDLDAVRAALSADTRMIWAETPSNPQCRVVDLAALAALAHGNGAILGVDSTFASPALQQPIALGADVVMHSTTKYIGGHSDVLGGALAFAQADARYERIARRRYIVGAVLSPFNAWLTLRGLRSLPARMAWHCRNARAVAEFLAAHQAVERVNWPGLPSHPQHALAARQMRDFGGMLSVQVHGGREAALAFAARLRVFTNATSLGGCESLVEHRASVEGVHPVSPENLLRLSVGLEHPDDLVEDLRQALA
jgi:cystathionine gamma-synthase